MPTIAQASYYAQHAMALQFKKLNINIIKEGWDISGAYYQTYNKYKQYIHAPAGTKHEGQVWLLTKCMPGSKDAGTTSADSSRTT